MEKINPFLEKEGTLYVAAATPEGNYATRTTKVGVDAGVSQLQGAIIRNDDGVTIANTGKSPMYVFLKNGETDPT